MKNLFVLVCALIISGSTILASTNPVQRETEKGKTISVEVVLEGKINLFVHETQVIPATIPEDPFESFSETYKSYYISTGESSEIVKLTCSNYKSELKSHMSDNSELSEKIGSKGYKFNDLSKIITKYNNE